MHAGCERCSVHVPGCRTTVGLEDVDCPVGPEERPPNPASDDGKWTGGEEEEDRKSGYGCRSP